MSGQNVNLSKPHTPYDHDSWISPVVDDIFTRDFNAEFLFLYSILKNSVNSPEILINILSNEQHESITKNKTIKFKKAKSHILGLQSRKKYLEQNGVIQ